MRFSLAVAIVLAWAGAARASVISVADVPFGLVAPGSSSALAVSVTSTGAGALNITGATITGGSWFAFSDHGCTGQSCAFATTAPTSFAVTCAPDVAGMQTATITVASNSDPGGKTVGTLTCTGGAPAIATDVPALTFAAQLVNTTSAAQVVTVSNPGSSTLTITSVTTAAPFAVTPACAPCTIPAGGSKPFSVTFRPTAPGAPTGTLALASDAGAKSVGLSGTGIAPQITGAAVTFDPTELGSTNQKSLVIGNSGGAPLHLTATTTTPADFTIATAGLTTIPANSSTTYVLQCAPTAIGTRTGTLTIASDSFTQASFAIALTCIGKGGALAANPTAIAFPGTSVHTTSTRTFVLTNPGNLDVAITSVAIAPATAGYTVSAPASPVVNGMPQTITATFAPMTTADGGPATLTITGTWGASATPVTLTVPITGQALSADLSVSTTTLDFQSFLYDALPTRTFCISNTSQSTVHVAALMINATGSTLATDFAVASVVKQVICGTGGTPQALPYDLAPSENLLVTIRAQPMNHAGMLTANAVVTTTLPVNPTRTVALMGTATSGLLSVDPASMSLDFGAVDVDTGPVSKTITLHNGGDGAVTLSGFAKTNAKFTVALPATTTLMPGGDLPLVITYDPAMVATDTMTITHAIQHSTTQLMETLTITGRGIDRVLVVPATTITAPTTFRNPGSKAPVLPVDVTNAGEAPLHISAAMIDVTDSWQLVDTAPIVVAPGETHHVLVRFAPTMAGMVPQANLVLTTDAGDPPNLTKTAMIALDGLALAPDVMVGPQPIDLGYTARGAELSIADILTVTSMDTAHAFALHRFELVGADGFEVVGATTDAVLDPGATATFGLAFTGEADATATINLYVDEDPTVASATTVTAHVVDVDVHGSGGCSTGGGSSAGLILVLGALLRRRAALLALLIPAVAAADDVDATIFAPTPQTAGHGFHVQTADVGRAGDYAVEAVVSYAANPLVIDSIANGMTIGTDRVIKQRTLFDLGVAFAFLGRFEAGVRMPMYAQSGDAFDPQHAAGMPGASGTARGNLVVDGKARLIHLPGFSLGAGLALTLPTATRGELAGSDKPEVHPLLLATFSAVPRLTLTINAGAALRATTQMGFVTQKSGFAWAGGASFQLTDAIFAVAEAFGESASQASGAMVTLAPAEGLVGGRFLLGDSVSVGLAVGRGLTTSAGAPELRGVVSLAVSQAVRTYLPHPPPHVDGDADGDGIPDSIDQCPNEPEDRDLFQDDDGCPDPDNDGDGIPDAIDKCPLDAEDKDGFEDEDGCPDRDNDGDGIPDDQDRCPNVPEDKDGFQDLDGCPDLDNDGDGIPDAKDRCPNEPETINGVQDEDGCPDRGDSVVVLGPDRIDTLEGIAFAGKAVNARASANVLKQIGATLRAHTELSRIRITVHVQPTSRPERDQELSDARAKAVKEWLVKYGIDEKRLDPRGFGGTKPFVAPTSAGAAQLNDRVELVIMERK